MRDPHHHVRRRVRAAAHDVDGHPHRLLQVRQQRDRRVRHRAQPRIQRRRRHGEANTASNARALNRMRRFRSSASASPSGVARNCVWEVGQDFVTGASGFEEGASGRGVATYIRRAGGELAATGCNSAALRAAARRRSLARPAATGAGAVKASPAGPRIGRDRRARPQGAVGLAAAGRVVGGKREMESGGPLSNIVVPKLHNASAPPLREAFGDAAIQPAAPHSPAWTAEPPSTGSQRRVSQGAARETGWSS